MKKDSIDSVELNEIEEWRPVVGYEEFYEVSNLGRVRSRARSWRVRSRWGTLCTKNRKSRILKGFNICLTDGQGRQQFYKRPHIVLMTFIGPRPKGMEACHYPDKNRNNNRLNNLRWDTHAGNMKDMIFHGTSRPGSRNHMTVITEEQVAEARRLYATGKYYMREIAAMYGMAKNAMRVIIRGITWKHVEYLPASTHGYRGRRIKTRCL